MIVDDAGKGLDDRVLTKATEVIASWPAVPQRCCTLRPMVEQIVKDKSK
jgi:hypothetical protein